MRRNFDPIYKELKTPINNGILTANRLKFNITQDVTTHQPSIKSTLLVFFMLAMLFVYIPLTKGGLKNSNSLYPSPSPISNASYGAAQDGFRETSETGYFSLERDIAWNFHFDAEEKGWSNSSTAACEERSGHSKQLDVHNCLKINQKPKEVLK